MKKYVIYLTEYPGNKLPRRYIGSIYEDNIIKNNCNGLSKYKMGKLYEGKIYEYIQPRLLELKKLTINYMRTLKILLKNLESVKMIYGGINGNI